MRQLTSSERARYARQLVLPEVGEEGQRRLADARVLVVGAGGLGSPSALYLAAAGVGTLGIVDDDTVDLSNLHRQILHDHDAVGRHKVDSARDRLHALAPELRVEPHVVRLDGGNAAELIARYDVVVDGSDNFATRYAVSDACVATGRPDVHASVERFAGQLSVLAAGGAPCYRCLFPELPDPALFPTCAEAGVLGAVPGVLGALQAAETLKLLLRLDGTLLGRLLLIDLRRMQFTEIAVERDPACSACGTGRAAHAPARTPGRTQAPGLLPVDVARRIRAGETLLLVDVRERDAWEAGHLPGAIHVDGSPIAPQLAGVERTRTVVVYCEHGIRSVAAAERVRAAGFEQVWMLEGGYRRWQREVGAEA